MWYDDATVDSDVDLAATTGANVVRVAIEWSSLETAGSGQYTTWYRDRLDRLINRADTNGIKVIAEVWASPCWASSAPDEVKQGCVGEWWTRGVPKYAPTDEGDFANITAYIAARYGTKLAAIELWNEPNISDFLIANDPAAEYMRLVSAAYPAIKAAAPSLPVLAGATSWADWPFIDSLYALGLKGKNDGISIHAYNAGRPPGEMLLESQARWTFLQGMRLVHAGQVSRDDDHGLWVTEFGWPSCLPGGVHSWCVTQAQQATYLHDAFRFIEFETYVKAATIYTLRNTGTTVSNYQDQFGIVNQDYTAKSSQATIAELFNSYP